MLASTTSLMTKITTMHHSSNNSSGVMIRTLQQQIDLLAKDLIFENQMEHSCRIYLDALSRVLVLLFGSKRFRSFKLI